MPLLDALAKPVRTGRAAALSLRQVLSEEPQLAELGWPKIQQALLVLVGAGHVQPCNYRGDGGQREAAKRFNRAVQQMARYSPDLQYLASPVTGGGIAVDRFQQLFLLASTEGEKDPVAFVWNVLDAQGQRLMRDGAVLEDAASNRGELNRHYEAFLTRLPTLKSLGIA